MELLCYNYIYPRLLQAVNFSWYCLFINVNDQVNHQPVSGGGCKQDTNHQLIILFYCPYNKMSLFCNI